MCRPGLVFSVALVAGGVACAQAVAPATELKQLEGRWLVAHRGYDLSKKTAEVAGLLTKLGAEVEIADGKLSAAGRAKTGYYLEAAFDPIARPKAIDLNVPGQQGRVLRGIYSHEVDVLTLAVGIGDARPRTLRPAKDQVVLILTRVRPRLYR
jgi:uncharacterized protein (TIGR03067 family)